MALQRRDVRDLNDTERGEYVDAVLKLKKDGTYDRLVQLHLTAMSKLTPAADPATDPGARTRNAAHIGPSFLPWHRWYLVLFERELQRVNPRVTLPYWNWTEEPADPARSRVFTEDFLGGGGDPGAGFRVTTGAFAFDRGRWTLNVDVTNGGRALRRRFGVIDWLDPASGRSGRMTVKLPFRAHLRTAMAETAYDAAPWDGGPTTDGFRNALEGWAKVGDNAAPNLHNLVHVYVGGGWVEGRRSLVGTMRRWPWAATSASRPRRPSAPRTGPPTRASCPLRAWSPRTSFPATTTPATWATITATRPTITGGTITGGTITVTAVMIMVTAVTTRVMVGTRVTVTAETATITAATTTAIPATIMATASTPATVTRTRLPRASSGGRGRAIGVGPISRSFRSRVSRPTVQSHLRQLHGSHTRSF